MRLYHAAFRPRRNVIGFMGVRIPSGVQFYNLWHQIFGIQQQM